MTPKRFFQIENDILNITLETSSEIGHQLVTNAFAIFLQEVLGYESVNIVTYDDHFNVNSSSSILQRLSGMDLLDTEANLSNTRLACFYDFYLPCTVCLPPHYLKKLHR